jgi:hypothetical protein
MHLIQYIYIYKFLDIESTNTKEGTGIIKPFNLLLSEARITDGMGGLVSLNIPRNARKLKLQRIRKSCVLQSLTKLPRPNYPMGS